jgi:hypothetical protein
MLQDHLPSGHVYSTPSAVLSVMVCETDPERAASTPRTLSTPRPSSPPIVQVVPTSWASVMVRAVDLCYFSIRSAHLTRVLNSLAPPFPDTPTCHGSPVTSSVLSTTGQYLRLELGGMVFCGSAYATRGAIVMNAARVCMLRYRRGNQDPFVS